AAGNTRDPPPAQIRAGSDSVSTCLGRRRERHVYACPGSWCRHACRLFHRMEADMQLTVAVVAL
ncbi:MAG: hypothetical protein AVDCRST_MAG71-2667, partial [uncultured Lysobacter sp.]